MTERILYGVLACLGLGALGLMYSWLTAKPDWWDPYLPRSTRGDPLDEAMFRQLQRQEEAQRTEESCR